MNEITQETSIEATVVWPLFRRLTEWFDANDWKYEEHLGEDESYLSAGVNCENGSWKLVAQASEEQRHIYFWSTLPMFAPENRRDAVAEFFTRANFGNRIGFFELDFSDGEMRFNVSIGVADGILTDAQIGHAVDKVLNGMDRYFPALMSVIYGGKDPAEAQAEARGQKATGTESGPNAEPSHANGRVH